MRRAWPALALPLLAACADRDPLLPPTAIPLPATTMATLNCTVSVSEMKMSCVDASAGTGPRATKILGGQDKYVKLASSGTSYDGGTQVLSSNVTVQNLLQQAIGTTDGNTVTGVDVFFSAGPDVTSGGAGSSVSVLNPDGIGTFTATNQRYFHYAQILGTYQISSAKGWQFQISGSVSTFTFTVYVSAPMVDENASLLDKVWTGATSTAWATGSNWQGGVVPDSASSVSIPADSLLAPGHFQPALSASVMIADLRVGYASSVTLNNNTLTAWGNVDAIGTITGGTLRMRGTGAYLGGSVNALEVTGSAQLQRATTASGAVSVTGTLNVKDQALTVSIP
ncbi:MAG TPA: hypothetical protein VJT67_12665 [Longimicrobiaceae bacterium]|nr:hypothetical protein [Longimicrobiaceae bacterium]